MYANVIAFNSQSENRAQMPPSMLADNVVSLDDWRYRPRRRRTPSGVFFSTRAHVSPGDAA